MGKWTALMKKLQPEKLPLEGGEKYQERVNKAKVEFDGQKAAELAHTYKKLRAERDELEETRSVLDCRIRAVEQLIVDTFADAGLERVNLVGGGSVGTEVEPYFSAEDPEVVRRWAVERGLAGKMALPWQTLNSEAKEVLLSEGSLVPGCRMFLRSKVVLHSK